MGAPAGWYDDPQDQQLIRYFDGTRWTEHTGPRPGAGSQQASQQRQPGTPGVPGATPQQTAGGWGAASGQQSWQPGTADAKGAQPQSPTAGFQFGGAQRPPAADATPSPGTPKSVKLGILGAFLACVALFAVGYAMTDRDSDVGEPLTASELGIDGITCDDLVDRYVTLSASDPDADRLVSATGGVEDVNELGTVRAPSGDDQNLVIGCSYPTAEWADGSTTPLLLDVSVDKDLGLYIQATASER